MADLLQNHPVLHQFLSYKYFADLTEDNKRNLGLINLTEIPYIVLQISDCGLVS
jgi:hypothetical protein